MHPIILPLFVAFGVLAAMTPFMDAKSIVIGTAVVGALGVVAVIARFCWLSRKHEHEEHD